jgi:hypothetical protein
VSAVLACRHSTQTPRGCDDLWCGTSKVRTLPQAGSARRTASWRGGKAQKAQSCRQLAANFLWQCRRIFPLAHISFGQMRLTKVIQLPHSGHSVAHLSLMSRACSCRPSVSAAARSDRPDVSRDRPLHVFRSAVRVRGIGFRVVACFLRFSSLPHLLRKLEEKTDRPWGFASCRSRAHLSTTYTRKRKHWTSHIRWNGYPVN